MFLWKLIKATLHCDLLKIKDSKIDSENICVYERTWWGAGLSQKCVVYTGFDAIWLKAQLSLYWFVAACGNLKKPHYVSHASDSMLLSNVNGSYVANLDNISWVLGILHLLWYLFISVQYMYVYITYIMWWYNCLYQVVVDSTNIIQQNSQL